MRRMINFSNLPVELLRLITVNLDCSSLRSLSLVNKRYRVVSTSDLFHSIKIDFSEDGLEKLWKIAKSSLAPCVRMLHYDASELVDPLIQNRDYFSACIYTPQEYVRDRKDFRWNLRGKEFTYKAIYSYFRRLARLQGSLLKERSDIHIFSESLPYLLNLRSVKLSFTGAREDQLLWFANRLFLENENSFLTHLEALSSGIVAAHRNGRDVESIEIDGLHPKSAFTNVDISGIVKASMMHIKDIKLVDSPGLLKILSSIPLPSLRRLDLADCWLAGSDLVQFLASHEVVVQHVHFHSIRPLYEKLQETRMSSECQEGFWEILSDAGNIGELAHLLILRDSKALV